MRTRHATLRQSGDRFEMWLPTQDKKHNTECVYGIYDGKLEIAGKVVKKHPAFQNTQQFENWCNRYIVEHNVKEV